MLKLQTFLRGNRVAAVAYIIVAVLLVLNFKHVKSLYSGEKSVHAKAATTSQYLIGMRNEETITSAVLSADHQQYTFRSLHLENNIVWNNNSIINVNDRLLEMMSEDNISTQTMTEEEQMQHLEDVKLEQHLIERAALRAEAAKQEEEARKQEEKAEKEELELLSLKETPLNVVKNKKMMKKLSSTDYEVLLRIVEAEATGEDLYGKILVANVVLNRVNDKEFPDTVEEVVFQRKGKTYQFSPIKDKRYWSVEVTDTTIEAVDRALAGEDYSKGAIYFFARKYTSAKKASWFDNSLKRLFRYGCHEFYKDK